MQAAAGAEDHEEVNLDSSLGSKGGIGFDKASPQIAGNIAPPSESKASNGDPETVSWSP